jgi:hypothetical protein
LGHFLLIGAGFSRNWDGPLSDEIAGSLLGEFQDDAEIASALRRGPFEDAFQGFQAPSPSNPAGPRLKRFQDAVTALFQRLNKTFINKKFEFGNDLSVKRFLARFDSIFSLNQDLLLEIHYVQTFVPQGKWTSVVQPGVHWVPPPPDTGPYDLTMCKWVANPNSAAGQGDQPFYKLHGSSNWQTESGEPLLIMGNGKTGAIQRFSVLRDYHEQFAARLNEQNAKLMVIGYSFQDEHINAVIERASREHGLGTYIVDLRGREVLIDPKMERLTIRPKRNIEDIKLIGEFRRPLSAVFGGDIYAHGELMRFFS